MAITNGNQTIGTAVTQVDGLSQYQSTLIIHNNDTTKDLLIGGPDMSAASGVPLAKLQYIELPIPPAEAVYVMASAGEVSISWMRITQD